MRASLLFVSLLFCLVICIPCKAQTQEYQLLMKTRGHELTALCMMESSADGRVAGTIVNEFGVKAFDFTYDKGKAKVLNVMGPLNKWYIRRVLRHDFAFLLTHLPDRKTAIKGKRKLTFEDNDTIHLVSGRYKIDYTFTPLSQEP